MTLAGFPHEADSYKLLTDGSELATGTLDSLQAPSHTIRVTNKEELPGVGVHLVTCQAGQELVKARTKSNRCQNIFLPLLLLLTLGCCFSKDAKERVEGANFSRAISISQGRA